MGDESWNVFYDKIREYTDVFVKQNRIESADSEYYRKIMRVLIFETLEQCAKETYVVNGVIKDYNLSDLYYCQYAPKEKDDKFYQYVAAYCDAENDFNSYMHFDKKMSNQYINYFADLAFFEAMNQEIQSNNLNDFKNDWL